MFSRTVVIPCAGMGSRLGFGTTKALVEVGGKPIILRHLEYLDGEEDVRIVVGYQAEKLIDAVNAYRKDIVYVYNHDYQTTGTGASVALAAENANGYLLTIDGDILIHPDDMRKLLACKEEFVGGCPVRSEDSWRVQTYPQDGKRMVSGFSKCRGDYEWNGIAQIKSGKIKAGRWHTFQILEECLPMQFLDIRSKEVDTVNDLEDAEAWVRGGFQT